MYNTYDVHFYASHALASLWPNLQVRNIVCPLRGIDPWGSLRIKDLFLLNIYLIIQNDIVICAYCRSACSMTSEIVFMRKSVNLERICMMGSIQAEKLRIQYHMIWVIQVWIQDRSVSLFLQREWPRFLKSFFNFTWTYFEFRIKNFVIEVFFN